jgi:hypothetical protein
MGRGRFHVWRGLARYPTAPSASLPATFLQNLLLCRAYPNQSTFHTLPAATDRASALSFWLIGLPPFSRNQGRRHARNGVGGRGR